ncbi:hypothetical protein P8452_64063 [Trifolium repens]|nr:hypothetical protein P8452_64063 [Trifolium repens]
MFVFEEFLNNTAFGIGTVSRDTCGMVITAAIWQRLDGHNVKEVEAIALLLAIQFAHNTGLDNVIFEFDYSSTVLLREYFGVIHRNLGLFFNCRD